MAHQEVDFVTVIADACFRAGGKTIKKGETLKCIKSTAQQLVTVGKAHYATPEDLQPEPEPEPEKGSGKGKK